MGIEVKCELARNADTSALSRDPVPATSEVVRWVALHRRVVWLGYRGETNTSLAKWSNLAQVVGSIGVVVSLTFVGLQVRQNTGALQRNEHNSTMEQWTVIRMAIAKHRDIAELITDGLYGGEPLDAADQFRLDLMLQEYAWATFHIWGRTQRGVFPPGTFESTAGAF